MSNLKTLYSSEEILKAAEEIMKYRISEADIFTSPEQVKDFLRFKIGHQDREHFMVLFLNAQNRLLSDEVLFSGTINQTSVYPREIVRRALQLNSSVVVLAHNHPSGLPEPSQADIELTKILKTACEYLNIRILDHIIIGNTRCFSFAEQGLI